MTRSALGQKITVNSVDVTSDVDCRLNITKRIPTVIIKSVSSQNNVNVSYFQAEESSPLDNLFITDRSTTVVQNRLPEETPQEGTVGYFTLATDKFLVTDTFTVEAATQEATPLFYAHTFQNFNPDNDDWGASKSLVSFQFVDHNFKPLDVSEYNLSLTEGKMYSNLENTYDADTEEFTVYFLQYTVNVTGVYGVVTTTYYELLNNEPAFHPASYSDIDSWGNLYPDSKAYLSEESLDGQSFHITLPLVTDYAWKELATSRLKLLEPSALTLDNPWYVRTTNGTIITSQLSGINTYANYKYRIAEFNNQSFSPSIPYKYIFNQRVTRLADKLLYVPRGIAVDTSLGLHLEIFVYDSGKTLKEAYTTNLTKDGTIYRGSIYYENNINSYDSLGGFIELDEATEETDIIKANYFITETEYELTGIDFNPTNNFEILDDRVVFYINPETSATGDLETSVYYLRVNSIGQIVYCSQADENSSGLDPATQKLLAEDFTTAGYPTHDFYYDVPSTASGLRARVSGVYSAFVDDLSFIDKYTVESALLDEITVSSGILEAGLLLNMQENPRFLVLGDVRVGPHQGIDDLITYDARLQGGGVKDSRVTDALYQQPEIMWYYDVGGEFPYPGGGAFYVEVPKSLYVKYGGDWTEQQVRTVVEKHMSAGGYAVIRPYGIDPVVTDIVVGAGVLICVWPSYGTGTAYNLYYSADRTNYTLGASVTDSGLSSNAATLSGLSNGTTYYVYVAAVNDAGYDEEGPVVSATTQ